jgi:hypothetical protein
MFLLGTEVALAGSDGHTRKACVVLVQHDTMITTTEYKSTIELQVRVTMTITEKKSFHSFARFRIRIGA